MINNQNLWFITSEEKVKFDVQFQCLNPVNGFITGGIIQANTNIMTILLLGSQAKSLFTKSNLPTDVLGKIWFLADYDKDGRMNSNEFAIAMHLIKRKLEGYEVPDALPLSLNPLQTSGTTMSYSGYMPVSSTYNTMPVMHNTTLPLSNNNPNNTMTVPHASAFVNYSTSSTMKSFSTSLSTSNAQFGSNNVPFPINNPPYTVSQDVKPPINVVSSDEDWVIPPSVRPRYKLQFNQQDRNKRGFLTGVEAKAILVQSGLPNTSLASIWSLADIDQDGNLTCEEFCIAMHLVEQARSGRQLPNQLPQSLLPNSFQKKNILGPSMSSSMNIPINPITNGLSSVSKSNQSEKESQQKSVLTGEDERRANYLKGQAELEKRRAILDEQMRQEEEARKSKERAEIERLEKIRQEKEQARFAEIQRQMEIRRQQELEREEQLRRVAEERERTRLESEKKRLLEMEKRRLEVAISERRQEQESLSEVNSKKGNLIDALANEKEKKRDLQCRIESTQMTLETYKAGIGSMREHRDKLIDTTDCLREELEAAKAELSRCQREKQNLELQLQSNLQSDPVLEQIKTVQALKSNHKDKIKLLDKEIKELEQRMTHRGQKLATNRNKVRDLEKKVTSKLLSDIKKLQTSVCEKKNAAIAILKKQKEPKTTVSEKNYNEFNKISVSKNPQLNNMPNNELVYYESVYAFEGRQHDEISFKTGDIIIINTQDQIEPSSGWLYGWLENSSHCGLFPEIYVRKLSGPPSSESVQTKIDVNQNISGGFADLFNNDVTPKGTLRRSSSECQWAEAIYQWKPESNVTYGEYPNQLSFEIGQLIKIIDTNLDDWWTGETTALDANGKEKIVMGWFPKTYVRLLDEQNANHPDSGTVTPTAGSLEDLASKYSSLNMSEKYDLSTFDVSQKLLCVARYPYQASVLGDLNIQPGDIIEILDQKQDWWKGYNRNTSLQGLFPSNYVKIVTSEDLANTESVKFSEGVPIEEMTDSTVDLMNASQHSAISLNSINSNPYSTISDVENNSALYYSQNTVPKNSNGASTPEIAQVVIEFNPLSTEQIPLQVGQLVQIREKSPSGWWKGEIQQRGQQRRIGWFPGQYVNIINSSQSIVSDSMYNDGSLTPPTCTTPTPMSSWINQDASSLNSTIELNDSLPGDHLITMYNYSAQNVDELSFDKNAVLVLIDKNEPEWWMGRNLLTSQEGLFPVNYVRRLQAGNASDEEAMKEVAVASSQYNVNVAGRPVSWYVDGTMTFNAILTEDEKRRQFYIRELIETEKVYYDDLQEVHQVFFEPIKKSNLLTLDELKSIFLNWSDLIPNSYNFFMALKIRKDLAGVKQPIQSFPNFIVYVRFCSMQNQAIAKLQKKQQSCPKFKELCETCEGNLRCQKMPMTSYFLKPMQRITKYKLLVENILKHTEDNHPDRSDMEEAVAAARSLCESVNEGVRERENSERLEWLQEHMQCENLSEKLYFNSNTNCLGHRKLIHSGTLSKFKSGKELVGFLFNDFFLLATPCYNTGGMPFVFPLETSSKDKMQFKMYKKPIILNQVMISSGSPTSTNSQFSTNDIFTVKEPTCEHILRALSQNDRDKWVERLMNASMFYINTENLKRECSMSIRRTAGVGRLLVTVVEGISLRSSSSHKDCKSDPFCEASLGNQLHRTKVVPSTLNPKWNTQMQFLIKNVDQDVLCLTVYNKDYFAPNDFLGRIEVSVNHVVAEKRLIRDPIEKRLKLMEVEQGELVVKLDLAMFKKN